MIKEPYLSIIIPVFNVEKYLPQCLDSILACLFKSYEIILVIGHSTDQSNNICQDYSCRHSQITVLTQSGNGLSNARNCGLNSANGKYVMYIDSDDYIDSNAFDKTIQQFYKCKDTYFDILISDFSLVNVNNEIYSCRRQIKNTPLIIEDYHYLRSFLNNSGNYWNVWRYLYRRQFLLENNITFKENYKSEDIDYSTNVLLRAKTCCFYHNPYYCYRVRRDGSLVNVITMQNVDNLLNILCDCIKEISNNTFPYSKILKNKLLMEYLYSLLLINDIDKNKKNEAYTKINLRKNILKQTTFGKLIYLIISILGIPLVSSVLFNIRRIRRFLLKLQ